MKLDPTKIPARYRLNGLLEGPECPGCESPGDCEDCEYVLRDDKSFGELYGGPAGQLPKGNK